MLKHQYSLKNHNSFGIPVYADTFFSFESLIELDEFLLNNNLANTQVLVLGEGCNILFTKDFKGTVVYPDNKGIKLLSENEVSYKVEVMAGEEWDKFVEYAVENSWYGLENLSLIPGRIGAVPVQNIGAYGKEAQDFIESVNCVDIYTGEHLQLSAKDCKFGYRDSIFKNELKNKCVITSVVFSLHKQEDINIEYKDIKERLRLDDNIDSKLVRKTICEIRNEKLPDHKIVGNVGSFFKNPVISETQFAALYKQFPNIVYYKLKNGDYKLAAGWLIDYCGWKSYVENGVGVHDKQALVLINICSRSGQDILNLANKINISILEKFDVTLEFEAILL